MTVVKIVLFCVGVLFICVSCCGALMIVSSDKESKSARKLYKWLFIVGAIITAIASAITLFK